MSAETITFQSGNSIAVRLLGDCRLPKGTRVREYRDGNRIILEPVDAWSDEFLSALGAWKDVEIELPPREPARDPFA